MADPGKVYPIDLNMLRKEVEIQGEVLGRERLERKAEVDELRLQVEVLKSLLAQQYPDFKKRYEELYQDKRENFNPEQKTKIG
ncbi:MAG: hypothetical protein A2X94_00340 [Bdellovibrionales bacterium GWB1_55_8]|nr:MAG: hypothetical protein A2X94_00340 [Bdellovibrionales bacterium GWB1_55_8]